MVPRWRELEPEVAAVEWLKLGVLAVTPKLYEAGTAPTGPIP